MPLLGLLEGTFCFIPFIVCAILSPVAGTSKARDSKRVIKEHTLSVILGINEREREREIYIYTISLSLSLSLFWWWQPGAGPRVKVKTGNNST